MLGSSWEIRSSHVTDVWSVPSAVQCLFLSARSVGILSSVILCYISSLLFSAVIYLIKLHILLTVLLNDSYYLTSYWRNYSNLHHIICIPLVAALLSASHRRRSKEQDYLLASSTCAYTLFVDYNYCAFLEQLGNYWILKKDCVPFNPFYIVLIR
jgi:hypothetical protein